MIFFRRNRLFSVKIEAYGAALSALEFAKLVTNSTKTFHELVLHPRMVNSSLPLFFGEKTAREPLKKGVTKMSQNRFFKYIKYFVHMSSLHTCIQPPSHRYHAVRKKTRVKNSKSLENIIIFLLCSCLQNCHILHNQSIPLSGDRGHDDFDLFDFQTGDMTHYDHS